MKQLTLFLSLLLVATTLCAQSELPADTIPRASGANMKEFGGFLLDMGLITMSPPKPLTYQINLPNATKDYNQLLQLNPDATYSQGFTSSAFSSSLSGYGYGFGASTAQYMQMGTFKLNNGMNLHVYGDYNASGYRVRNPSALPWERNNFRGAFELKSGNGAFGIRIEVQQGRKLPY